MTSSACRCGWDGKGDHPCHGRAYECKKPGKERFYNTGAPFSLAGAQMKFVVSQTIACDECWAEFSAKLKKG